MNQIEELKKIKSMLDEGILTETEFLDLKNAILAKESKNENSIQIMDEADSQKGNLKIIFEGQWFLLDVPTKLYVNGEFHSSHSTRNGFEVDIPLNAHARIWIIELVIRSIIKRKSTYEIELLDPTKNYTMELTYSDTWGKYSETNFYLTENNQATNDPNKVEFQQIVKKRGNTYTGWIVAITIALILTLPFHYVFYQNNFTMFPKNQMTFSNTVLTDEDIEGLIKRYNDASLYERQAINNEPLMRKLKEKEIIIEKGLFD